MRHALAGLVGLSGLVLATGCATIPEPYVPQAVGPVQTGIPDDGLRLSIAPAAESVPVGNDVVFTVTLTNEGARDIRIPRRPQVIFHWVYSNGIRDNYVVDRPSHRFYHAADLRVLQPGTSLTFEFNVPTGYFPRTGITEFQAVAMAPPNTNPSVDPVWSGEAHSNRYGILMRPPGQPHSQFALAGTGIRTIR